MPLPLLLIGAAALSGATGLAGAGIGATKMKKANEQMKLIKERHQANLDNFEIYQKKTLHKMDQLGAKELQILQSFEEFSSVFEKIHNKPTFSDVKLGGINIPKYDGEELKEVSIGAGVLLGGIGGATLGTAGGFAAAGATSAAVTALGTASTGTAIASLSGVAATNATLAALGGGALSAGGGGMALGSSILSGATLGVGLLIGGAIFGITGFVLSAKADEAFIQMEAAEKEIVTICNYLAKLYNAAEKFEQVLEDVNILYRNHFNQMQKIVEQQGKTDWQQLNNDEQLVIQNCVLLVGVLFKMCKVKLVKITATEEHQINSSQINQAITEATAVLEEFNFKNQKPKENYQKFSFKKIKFKV